MAPEAIGAPVVSNGTFVMDKAKYNKSILDGTLPRGWRKVDISDFL